MRPVRSAVFALVVVVAVFAMPFLLRDYEMSIFSQALEYVLLGLGLNLVFGFAGRASFGHSGLYGVAAYTFALIETSWHWGLVASAAVGIVAGVVVAGFVGLPMLRLRGHYLALGTLAFGFVIQSLAQQLTSVTGGNNGLLVRSITPRTHEAYWILAALATLAVYLSYKVGVTRLGRALIAIREDEDAARSLGVSVERYVWWAFVASAGLVAFAGVMRVSENAFVAPELIDMRLNVLMLLLVVLGGLANTFGVTAAALVLAVLPHLLFGFENRQNLVYGVALIVILILSPRGLGVWIAQRLHRAKGRHVAEPETVVPAAVTWPAAMLSAAVVVPISVEVSGLTKRFGGVTALNDVHLEVHGGEILAVIGPNGAGKSTLVNCLSGLLRPDAGSIRIDGVAVPLGSSEAMVRAGVVRTFQLNRVFEQMTVVENILVGRHTRSRLSAGEFLQATLPASERAERALAIEIADLVGLAEHRDHYASDLSYGQKRLLEFGRALAAEPRLLILDEPAAGLHPNRLSQMHHHIASVAAHGTAVILIEHRMPLVLSVSHRIAVLNEGRNLVVGKPRDVLNDPAVMEAYLGHAFAARR